MLKIGLLLIALGATFFMPTKSQAQFYTVRKLPTPDYILLTPKVDSVNNSVNQQVAVAIQGNDRELKNQEYHNARRPPKRGTEQVKRLPVKGMPELTIANLMREIERNGIAHPKIVLAQAILETGWFQSHVCRTKNNLFGLTNPRTGEYYEFDHWTDSVRAYYTKVQYRYKGGNYLLWLKKIGYAEAPDYIQSLAAIINQYMID